MKTLSINTNQIVHKLKTSTSPLTYGFTLIELLIVIAVLGVLAAVVLIAINPAEQLAKSRDAGRLNDVTGLGHAVTTYYSANSVLPPVATWYTALVAAGEIPPSIVAPANTPACNTNPLPVPNPVGNGTFCYVGLAAVLPATVPSNFVVWVGAESLSSRIRANGSTGTPCAAANSFYVYDSVTGTAGLTCNPSGTLQGLTEATAATLVIH